MISPTSRRIIYLDSEFGTPEADKSVCVRPVQMDRSLVAFFEYCGCGCTDRASALGTLLGGAQLAQLRRNGGDLRLNHSKCVGQRSNLVAGVAY